MQLKCSRYIFTYTSAPDVVEDFILRSDDLASQTYGRDKYFSRLNQVLEQARFLGWPLPRFGSDLPEELTEIPLAGIDHIFENQSKLLIDVAPTTQIMLESGKYCPLKMVPGTTAAGDLVWRCHLLLDTEGTPYIQRNGKKFKVKTKGTKIVCQAEVLPYDGNYLFECFGGDEGVFPVPFLPEFFSDRQIAHKFSPEAGVIEIVYIREDSPVKVLANDIVPWYRPLEINYTKALASNSEDFDNDVSSLVPGWNDLQDGKSVELEAKGKSEDEVDFDEQDIDSLTDSEDDIEETTEEGKLTNLIVDFNSLEKAKYDEYEKILNKLDISSKAEADELRNDPKTKDKAEKWLLAAVNRLRIIANSSMKIGAVVDLINKHVGQQILVIQPRQKWAAKLAEILNQRGLKCHLYDSDKKSSQVNRFNEGEIQILVTATLNEELFIGDIVIISVTSINYPDWLEYVDTTQLIYMICNKELGYNDANYISEKEGLQITTATYDGPSLDILKLSHEENEKVKVKEVKEVKEPEPKEVSEEDSSQVQASASTEAGENTSVQEEKPKEAKAPKQPKFKVKIVGQTQGRPKTASSYEKALELAHKQETDGKKCEVYGPDSEEALYISGIGELNK